MRIIAWNICAGGGKRVPEINDQLKRWKPDLIALSEFRGTAFSLELASLIKRWGLIYQLDSTDRHHPATNSLLLASRHRLKRIRLRSNLSSSQRWLMASVDSNPPIIVGAMHVPNRITGKKYPFQDSVLELVSKWKRGKALLIGDTNSGIPGIDEEVPAFNKTEKRWIENLHKLGWIDAFRKLHHNKATYTWYSPNKGNGFRLDQAFINRPLLPHLRGIDYKWANAIGTKRNALSDHAAIVLDLSIC